MTHVSYILILLINGISVFTYEYCNRTVSREEVSKEGTVTLRMSEVRHEDNDKPLYCWFRFHTSPPHVIQVDVKNIRAGDYNTDGRRCESGFLRISDREACSTEPAWLPPTTLCGHYDTGSVRVKRITRSQSAFVEFKLDRARTSKGYEFDVTFVDSESPDEKLPYGHLQRHLGRIPDTKCDWLIPVDECFASCQVVSPGWPGIYPPNTRCQYLFTNFDDARVELRMGGRLFSGHFDMKQSPNCSEDYVEVYDGMSTINPLFGRWCGQVGDHVISAGSSLLLVFQSGPGGPPWNYSGFDVRVHDRWKDNHDGGQRVPGKGCDWLFESRDSQEGDTHSPDFMLQYTTVCTYTFQGDFNQHVELEIHPRYLLPNCQEFVEVQDGSIVLDKLCAHNLTRFKNEFKYNITSNTAHVKYYNLQGQKSNPDPVWIYYKFKTDLTMSPPATTKPAPSVQLGQQPQDKVLYDPDVGESTSSAHTIFHLKLVSHTLFLLVFFNALYS